MDKCRQHLNHLQPNANGPNQTNESQPHWIVNHQTNHFADCDNRTASGGGQSIGDHASNSWLSTGQLQANPLATPTSTGGDGGGGATSGSSSAAMLGINSRELNFGEIESVWLIKSWPEILLRVACVAPIVLLGIVGNLTIIYSMCKSKRFRSKPTNIFILNMALADLLTTIVCPNAALLTDIYQFYVLGAFVCRLEGCIKITCLLVSAYSLIVLSFDWLLCVVQPCRTRISIRQSWWALISIWIISILMASPLFVWRNLRQRQWKDLLEVWCCEQIQYTKFYWLGITFCLIYLPTFIMTIVLVVILLQMDKFEAKLRRSRINRGQASGGGHLRAYNGQFTPTPSSTNQQVSSIFAESKFHNVAPIQQHNAAQSTISEPSSLANAPKQQQAETSPNGGGVKSQQADLNGSLSISIKYRRRIVKILFTYLMSSIICWSPLQFSIIYRHFRSEAVPAGWFFELAFYSQIFASLSSAMNPIIFGYLTNQRFRRIVTKSWMFRLLDKLRFTSSGGGGGGANQLNYLQPNNQQQQQQPRNIQHPHYNAAGGQQRQRRAQEQLKHNHLQVPLQHLGCGRRNGGSGAVEVPLRQLQLPMEEAGATSGPRVTLDFVDCVAPLASNAASSSTTTTASRWRPAGEPKRASDAVSANATGGAGHQPVAGTRREQQHPPAAAPKVHRPSSSNHALEAGRRKRRHATGVGSRRHASARVDRLSLDRNNNGGGRHNAKRVSFNTSAESLQQPIAPQAQGGMSEREGGADGGRENRAFKQDESG